MRKENLFISRLVNLSVFLILEGLALFMVNQSSLIQKSGIIKGFHSVNASIDKSIDNIGEYFALKQNNLVLAQENAILREENHRLQELIRENESIAIDSTLLSYSKYTYIPARVISNQTNKQHNVIIIDKGYKDGIREDMGIITAKGVIGYVLATGENYSIVCSLLDTDNMLSATIASRNIVLERKINKESHSERYPHPHRNHRGRHHYHQRIFNDLSAKSSRCHH